MPSDLLNSLVPLLVGAGGWFATHLLATWRQTASNQSEYRWKLLATYGEFISNCSKCLDRAYQWKAFERSLFKYHGAVPPEVAQELKELEKDSYLARAAVDSSWTLLELLEHEPDRMEARALLNALDAYDRANDDVGRRECVKHFFGVRERLGRSLHRDLVSQWKPLGVLEIAGRRLHRIKHWLKQKGNHVRDKFRRRPVSKGDAGTTH